jgi:hypothetical protein
MFRLVSSTWIRCANVISVLISASTSARASPAGPSTPLIQPVEQRAPVTSAISAATRSTGTCCFPGRRPVFLRSERGGGEDWQQLG